jgi:hypothetical protein
MKNDKSQDSILNTSFQLEFSNDSSFDAKTYAKLA